MFPVQLFNQRHIFAASPCSLRRLIVGGEVLIKSFPVFVFFWMDVNCDMSENALLMLTKLFRDLGVVLIQTKDSFLIVSLLSRTVPLV
jgi:hypothetical protein